MSTNIQTGEGPYLDTTYPYIKTNEDGLVDTSGLELPNGNEYVQGQQSDIFEMWMMFQPSNGIPVPLRAVNWFWSGSATNVIFGGGPAVDWSLESGTNSVNPQGSDTEIFPVWNSNLTNAQWIHPLF